MRWRSIEVWPKVEDWGSDLRAAVLPGYPSLLRFIAARIGEPLGTDGAIRFDGGDGNALYALLIALIAEGWSWTEDAYLLPDDDDIILLLDHHGVVHAEFRSEERLAQFTAALAAGGFPLPTEPPDRTFKRAPWMDQHG